MHSFRFCPLRKGVVALLLQVMESVLVDTSLEHVKMVQVQVSEGVLEGEVVNNEYGGSFCSFKGIPYAEPPVGDLRFKAPQPAKPWTGVRSAKEFGPICYSYAVSTQSASGSEDCLYLNVYTPEIQPESPLPVMVWIHGGGFSTGSGNDDLYGPEFLVRHDVILVTINYRLHSLGFLCLHTEDIPGNAGMKDQVAALKWVKKNIKHFGGDADNVTIFGESSGGASASWHLLSPMSKGLFRRVIAQSGVATCLGASTFEPRERAIALAKKLGFQSEDDKELYQFFKSQPLESFNDNAAPMILTETVKVGVDMIQSIVSEKQFGNNERFFYGNLMDALKNGIHEGVEVIAGYCKDEGIIKMLHGIEKLAEQANNYKDVLVPNDFLLNNSLKEQFEISRLIREFYFGDKKISMENALQLIRFYGTDMFIFHIIQWQQITASKTKNKLYLYKFTAATERNLFTQLFASQSLSLVAGKPIVSHGDDLPYLFPLKLFPQKVNQDSDVFNIIDNVGKLWTNFAKYGNPTPDNSFGVTWSPYTLEQQDYLDIGQTLMPGTAPDNKEFKFWEDIYKKYLPSKVL